MTILHTPYAIRRAFYANLDLRARVSDEISAVSVGRAYVGLYRTEQGVEVCWGILNANEAL
jgi:hypothetical protein